MRLSIWLVILHLLLVPGLRAQDAGELDASSAADSATEDATVTGCGTLSYQGRCDGDTVQYCAAGEVQSVDCSNPADYPRGGPWVTCGLLDCAGTGCAGYWCVAKPGSACGELGCDVSQDLGCLGGVCAPSSACDPETYPRSCDEALLSYCRYTVADLDCSQGGTAPFTCLLQGETVEPCVGLEGAACDPLLGRLCVDGLICSGGRCARDPDRDAGPGAPDAADAATGDSSGSTDRGRSDAGTGETPGCGCGAAARGTGTGLGLLILAGLATRRRSRFRLACAPASN